GRVPARGPDMVVARTDGDTAAGLLDATGGQRFDAVLDTVGGDLFGAHLSVLREEGTLVTCGAHAGEVVPLDLIPLYRNGWRLVGFRPPPPHHLAASLALIRLGTDNAPIAAPFPCAH